MIVNSIGYHFRKRWQKRVRYLPIPCLESLNAFLTEGKKIRSQRNDLVRVRKDGSSEPYKLLAEYWMPRFSLIVKVDEDTRKAVTVINIQGRH